MKNPLVVGYRGEIGSYILNGLIKYLPSAAPIMCYDINEFEGERAQRIQRADVIFLCVPIDKTVEFFETYKNLLKGKTIVEQTSLKSEIMSLTPALRYGINLLSMHILFRPSVTPDLKDRTTILIGEKFSGEEQYIIDFIRYGLQTNIEYFSTWKKHDETMALQQAVVHRIILTLGELLETNSTATTYIGKQILKLKLRIQQGDYSLYKMIQENPYLIKKLREFNKRMSKFDLATSMKKVSHEKQGAS